MKKLSCTILFALTAVHFSSAADAPAAAVPPAPTPAPAKDAAAANSAPAEVPAIVLKNKSSFGMEPGARNPFWPIGWKPAVKNPAASGEYTGPEVPPTAFLVSSIVLDPGAKFAIVNGKTMEEGQVFGLQLGNQTYQITVKSIEDGKVIFARRDEEIEVPLHRR